MLLLDDMLDPWSFGVLGHWNGRGEQAKKRQLIEQRLQDKLRKETDSVRHAKEAKKDKTSANHKEEDLQLKDSIVHFPFSVSGYPKHPSFSPTRLVHKLTTTSVIA